jgi:hypothetical protein
MRSGHCHCEAFELSGEPTWTALCHCSDCRRHAGAPAVGWAAYPEDALKVVKGKPKIYESSANGRRHFCPDCGSGLVYYNAVNLPGIADVQIATLDDPASLAPTIQVQAAERIAWMERAHELPAFDRYPSKG